MFSVSQRRLVKWSLFLYLFFLLSFPRDYSVTNMSVCMCVLMLMLWQQHKWSCFIFCVFIKVLLFYAFLCNFYIYISGRSDDAFYWFIRKGEKEWSLCVFVVVAEYSNYREQCYFILEFFITVTTLGTLMIKRKLKHILKIIWFFL